MVLSFCIFKTWDLRTSYRWWKVGIIFVSLQNISSEQQMINNNVDDVQRLLLKPIVSCDPNEEFLNTLSAENQKSSACLPISSMVCYWHYRKCKLCYAMFGDRKLAEELSNFIMK